MTGVIIRDARPGLDGDAAACAAIYAPYVTDTVISFELEPPSVAAMAERIADAQRRHVWLVAEVGGAVAGFAYAHDWNSRVAYRWACETSIYLDGERRGSGIGRRLYGAVLDRITEQGFRVAVAGVALPNPASLAIHEGLGFTQAAHYRGVGFKFDRWHDVVWLSRPLGPGPVGVPDETRSLSS